MGWKKTGSHTLGRRREDSASSASDHHHQPPHRHDKSGNGIVHVSGHETNRHDAATIEKCEAYAAQGQWDKFLQAVRASTADDWNVVASNTTSSSLDDDIVVETHGEMHDDIKRRDNLEPHEHHVADLTEADEKRVDKESDPAALELTRQASKLPRGTTTSTTMIQTTTPLHLALRHGACLETVQAVADTTRDVLGIMVPHEAPDAYGDTPLHTACRANCTVNVVHYLLSGPSGILPAIVRNTAKQTALHVACATRVTTPSPPTTTTTTTTRTPPRRRKWFSLSSTTCTPTKGLVDPSTAAWHKQQVVDALLDSYPVALTLPDATGRTPLQAWKEAQHNCSINTELRMKRLTRAQAQQKADASLPGTPSPQTPWPTVLEDFETVRTISGLTTVEDPNLENDPETTHGTQESTSLDNDDAADDTAESNATKKEALVTTGTSSPVHSYNDMMLSSSSSSSSSPLDLTTCHVLDTMLDAVWCQGTSASAETPTTTDTDTSHTTTLVEENTPRIAFEMRYQAMES